ncbi:MAG: hypothetical protein WAX38_04925 [Minisyncoccia bacterium]
MRQTLATISTATALGLMAVVPVFAQTSALPSADRMMPAPMEKKMVRPQYNGSCVATAVGVREDMIIAARTTHNTAVVAALGVRKTELMAAWNQADAVTRRTARQAGWNKFRTTTESARRIVRADVSAAFTQFNASVKACGVQYSEQASATDTVN